MSFSLSDIKVLMDDSVPKVVANFKTSRGTRDIHLEESLDIKFKRNAEGIFHKVEWILEANREDFTQVIPNCINKPDSLPSLWNQEGPTFGKIKKKLWRIHY